MTVLGFSAISKSRSASQSRSGSVTVAVQANPGGSTLSGTATVAASHGVASFTGLRFNKADPGYTLRASGGGLTAATTTPITVSAGAATQLVVTAAPASNVALNAGFGLTVSA